MEEEEEEVMKRRRSREEPRPSAGCGKLEQLAECGCGCALWCLSELCSFWQFSVSCFQNKSTSPEGWRGSEKKEDKTTSRGGRWGEAEGGKNQVRGFDKSVK